jgi:phosphonate transport system substrate-binding protein
MSALLASAIAFPWSASAIEPLRIAPLPMENREATVKAFNPVVTYLQQKLGQPVELVYFDKNSEIVAALQNRSLDVGMLGPLPYVTLRLRGADVEPLIFFKEASGEARYRCALVVFGGDSSSVKALRGKRVALTQPLSTCGYLGTNALLRKYGGIDLEETRYSYLNTHEAAALAVVAGEAEAAGIKDDFALKFAPLGLHTVGYTDWVPAIALVANRATLDEKRIADIRRILLATPASVYQRWGNAMQFGMATAADADFNSLRRLGDPATIPQRPAATKAK